MSQPGMTTSEKMRRVWSHPAGRVYAILAVGGLLLSCYPLYTQGLLPQAALLAVVGLCGIFLQMSFMPFAFLILMTLFTYFAVTPHGIFPMSSSYSEIPGNYARIMDVIFVGSALTYFIAQYRLLTIISTGMPGPSRLIDQDKPRQQRTVTREAGRVTDSELRRIFATILTIVVAGQGLWFLVTAYRIRLGQFPSLRKIPSGTWLDPVIPAHRPILPEWGSRMTLVFGGVLLFAAVAGFLFWYWRRLAMNRDEGTLAVLDEGWREDRRELARMETWRAWALYPKKVERRRKSLRWMGCLLAIVLIVPLLVVFGLVMIGLGMLLR